VLIGLGSAGEDRGHPTDDGAAQPLSQRVARHVR
jgi:hypothetical protein